jgi:hypothetical protein
MLMYGKEIPLSVLYNLLSLYLSVKRSHHVRREDLEIPTLIQKREYYTLLNFMKIWRPRFIKRIHKFRTKTWVLRSHHVRQESLHILTLIQKREEYTLLDFMKIWRPRLIQGIHKFGIKTRKSKESIFNTSTINKYINSELKKRKIVVDVYIYWESKKN